MSVESKLAARWSATLGRLGVTDTDGVGFMVMVRYSEPHRHYHHLGHLAATLTALDVLAEPPGPSPIVQLAAWFHDVIYDPKRHDNEERSAELAVESLEGIGVHREVAEFVAELVLATKTHDVAGPVSALLIDADLAILGAPMSVYKTYAEDIRQEYAHVPEDRYRAGRAAVLRGFLDRPAIFSTPTGLARLEMSARTNLSEELAHLSLAGA